MTKKYIIYHDSCLDGLMSACVFQYYLNTTLFNDKHNYTFLPGCYSKSIEDYDVDFTDSIVYFLDFSFKTEPFKQLLNVAQRVVVIDHHKTAFEMLEEFEGHSKLYTVLDNNHCGCVLTYNYLYPDTSTHISSVTKLLEAIEDVDIWLHRDVESKYLTLALSQNLNLENLYDIYKYCFTRYPSKLVHEYEQGKALYNQLEVIAESERKSSFTRNLDYFGKVRFINNSCKQTQTVHSQYYLDTNLEDTLIFFKFTDEGINFSIRSNGKVDCTKLAKFISPTGGGHLKASGAAIKQSDTSTGAYSITSHPLVKVILDRNYQIVINRFRNECNGIN